VAEQSIHDPIVSEDQDILDRRYLAERIINRLNDETCPQVLGIYGSWGTGKTSLLNLIQEKWGKSGDQSLQIEYVDAWHYEGSGNLFVPIIVRMMSKRAALNPDLGEYIKRVSFSVLYMGTDIALRALTGGVSLGDAKMYQEDIESSGITKVSLLDWEKFTDKVEETQIAFRKLVDAVNQKSATKRTIFLIDNLDRCSPENTVGLLESIKNFLIIPGCVWVFAMDAEVVASYIKRKYEGTAMDGNSYLDKIIPEQYHLSFFPEENDHRVFDLISNATGGSFTLDEGRFPQIPRVMVPRRLILSAGKLAEYFAGNMPNVDSNTVFLMSLLYHTWPDFYERLSSSSLKHIGGILANFYGKDQPDGTKKWGDFNALSLGGDFAGDKDIIYFLQTAFPRYDADAEIVSEIKRALDGLRQIGLP